jgi:hypothetical protein
MPRYEIPDRNPSILRRLAPLLIVLVLTTFRLSGFATGPGDAHLYGDTNWSEYDAGSVAGYDDGFAGLPAADTSGQSADYQNGYSDGYAMGQLDRDTLNEGSDPQAEYDNGWIAGYDDGFGGLAAADNSGQSTDYQNGYSDGYSLGQLDRDTTMEYAE